MRDGELELAAATAHVFQALFGEPKRMSVGLHVDLLSGSSHGRGLGAWAHSAGTAPPARPRPSLRRNGSTSGLSLFLRLNRHDAAVFGLAAESDHALG